MNKIVINGCFGGFSLSREAAEWLNEHYNLGIELNKRFPDMNDPDLERYDPRLVECVETLGHRANGTGARLEVVTIDGNRFIITDYDGLESVYWPEMDGWEEIPEKK